ncbi:hypothetical protein ACIQNG_18745 [Streptomyces sp. NPDC091377]|uniref:hypothetical protein n=1 Tax=unclassified Streptomyces TaxID=2593676 RepID=UPI00381297FD
MTDQSMSIKVSSLVKVLRNETPECVAAGVVDMATGMLLGVETVDSHPSEVLDLLAAATFDLFRGRNVSTIEEIFKKRRGTVSDVRYFQEVLVNSENLVHVFVRIPSNNEIVAVAVARRGVNIGMLLNAARRAVNQYDFK